MSKTWSCGHSTVHRYISASCRIEDDVEFVEQEFGEVTQVTEPILTDIKNHDSIEYKCGACGIDLTDEILKWELRYAWPLYVKQERWAMTIYDHLGNAMAAESLAEEGLNQLGEREVPIRFPTGKEHRAVFVEANGRWELDGHMDE